MKPYDDISFHKKKISEKSEWKHISALHHLPITPHLKYTNNNGVIFRTNIKCPSSIFIRSGVPEATLPRLSLQEKEEIVREPLPSQ